MVAVLAATAPNNIKFTIDNLFGEDDFAVSARAFWALRENMKTGNHKNQVRWDLAK